MEWYIKIWTPISWLYGGIVWLRNWLYDRGVFKGKTYEVPILCIGNLSVGGTGKTPMVEFLIRHLGDKHKIAVLSRGYGRKSQGFLMADENSSVADLGDEPFQIHTKFPEITVAVDADRRNGIATLLHKVKPSLILLDDAFQHRKVTPKASILLSAYGSLYAGDNYLPTGKLRDHKNQAKRADIIVVTKCPRHLSKEEKEAIREALNPKKEQLLLFSTLVYDAQLKGEVATSFQELKEKDATLVTGIANPKPLLHYLEENGWSPEHLAYRDHFFFKQKQIDLFNTKSWILTTEKDYTRLKGRVANLSYIGIRHEFLGDGEQQLLKAIAGFTKQDS